MPKQWVPIAPTPDFGQTRTNDTGEDLHVAVSVEVAVTTDDVAKINAVIDGQELWPSYPAYYNDHDVVPPGSVKVTVKFPLTLPLLVPAGATFKVEKSVLAGAPGCSIRAWKELRTV